MRFGKNPRWFLIVISALSLVLAACGGTGSGSDKRVTIGTLSWEESIAATEVWKHLLEEQGYTVDVKQLEAGPAYQALSTGQIDLFPEQWPNYFASYIKKYRDDLHRIGEWYKPTELNLSVPEYMTDINTIEDLKGRSAEFRGRVVGIEAGSEIMKTLEEKVAPGYGIEDYKIVASSTPAMIASMEQAIKEKQPIVVTLWQPHWAFTKYPIKSLKDPKSLFGGSGVIEGVANKEFAAENPRVVEMLEKFKLTADQLGSLELMMQDLGSGRESEAAERWIRENKSLVDSWTA